MAGYTGTGFADKFEADGAAVTFRVNGKTAGTYPVDIRYANGNADAGTMSIYANGNGTDQTLNTYVNGSFAETATLSSLGTDWNVWDDWQTTLVLNAGQNRIAFTYDAANSGHVNLDQLRVTVDSTAAANVERNILDNGNFERPTWESSKWTEWHPDGQSQAYGIDKGIGMNPPETAREGEQRAYFYLASAYQQSIHQVNTVDDGKYRLEFWARCFNTAPTIARAEVKNGDGTTQYMDIPQTSEWKHFVLDDLTLSGDVDVGFYVNSPGGTTLQIDGVRLTKEG